MILLDAHVHVYPFYDLARFLDAAVANMPLPSPSDHRGYDTSKLFWIRQEESDILDEAKE